MAMHAPGMNPPVKPRCESECLVRMWGTTYTIIYKLAAPAVHESLSVIAADLTKSVDLDVKFSGMLSNMCIMQATHRHGLGMLGWGKGEMGGEAGGELQ